MHVQQILCELLNFILAGGQAPQCSSLLSYYTIIMIIIIIINAKSQNDKMNTTSCLVICFHAEVETEVSESCMQPRQTVTGGAACCDWIPASVHVSLRVNRAHSFPTSSELALTLLALFQSTNRKQLCVFALLLRGCAKSTSGPD